jgi:hypothetical protein
LSSFVVEVLKTFEIYLHQLIPEAIIRMNIFVWAVRSQGLEPNTKSFCNIHELLYETKPWGKEQYHNNFGCYSFGARSGSSCPVPTFRKRWPGDWMTEWFYVKNDLKSREDIKGIIMRPICNASASGSRRWKWMKQPKNAREPSAWFVLLLGQEIWFKSILPSEYGHL